VFMVLDGKEEKPGPDIVKASLSPGGDRVVYVASRNNKVSVVLDGQEGPQYDEITDMVFSPDGKRLAYIARQGDQWCAVIDGKQGKGYGDYWTDTLLFSPDGRRVAYMAAESKPWKIKALGETKMMVKGEGAPPKNRPKWVVVVDGKEEKPFDYGTPYIKDGGWEKPKADGTLVFSPNSRRMAYVALSGQIMKMKVKNGPKVMELEGGLTKWFVIVDGKKEKEFDEVREGSIVFSPDNRHVAYVAKAKDKWAVVVDGKERKSYDRIVSYGGRVIFDSADKLSYLAREGSDIYLVEESLN
jgi:glucose/arabinose dehydrogenase